MNKWISVKDKLPKEGDFVACVNLEGYINCQYGYNSHTAYVSNNEFLNEKIKIARYENNHFVYEELRRSDHSENGFCQITMNAKGEITHWVKIPFPPKFSKNELKKIRNESMRFTT